MLILKLGLSCILLTLIALFCYRYVKFDTFHPAVDRGLPVTRVISRVVLQELLAKAAKKMAGKDVILNDCKVVDYTHEVWPAIAIAQLAYWNSYKCTFLHCRSMPLANGECGLS